MFSWCEVLIKGCGIRHVWLAIPMNSWREGTIYTRKSGRQLTEKYFIVKEKEVTNRILLRDCAWVESKINFVIKQQPTNTAKLNQNLYPYGRHISERIAGRCLPLFPLNRRVEPNPRKNGPSKLLDMFEELVLLQAILEYSEI